MIKNSLGKSGSVPEELSVYANATAVTTGMTTIATLTLTPGSWLVSVSGHAGGGGATSSHETNLIVKGVNNFQVGNDYNQTIVNGSWGGTLTFTTRKVDIAPGDANKTIVVQDKANGANSVCYANIRAIRLSF